MIGVHREIVEVWLEHGIPVDSSTVEHALTVIQALVEENEKLWKLVKELSGETP